MTLVYYRWERKFRVTEIFHGYFMQTSCLPYCRWQFGVRIVCWTVNIKYTLNVTCVLVEKKWRNAALLTPTLIYVGLYGSKFSRSRERFSLSLNSEERFKRFSFLETTIIYLNKVKYLRIKTDMIKTMFEVKYIWQFCVNLWILS